MSSESGWGRWLDDLAGAAALGRGGGRAGPDAVLRAKGAVGRLVEEAGLSGGLSGMGPLSYHLLPIRAAARLLFGSFLLPQAGV